MVAHDRWIAGITEALEISRSPTMARSLKSVSISSLTITDDRPIVEECFHIIADDHWQFFSDPAIVSDHGKLGFNLSSMANL